MHRGLKIKFALLAAVVLTSSCEREIDHASRNKNNLEQSTPNDKASEPSKHLNDLDWLEGNWEERDENITVTTSWELDTNKNFLNQHFSMHTSEHPDLKGQQIVGWDPVDKKVHSWVFDSDGGFGHSIWSQQGNSWYSSMIFTLSDGRQATALHIYTKIDDNTYTFSSENREIDGRVMPNMGPFKFVKKQAVTP